MLCFETSPRMLSGSPQKESHLRVQSRARAPKDLLPRGSDPTEELTHLKATPQDTGMVLGARKSDRLGESKEHFGQGSAHCKGQEA